MASSIESYFNFGQIPLYAARRPKEALLKLAALFDPVDRCVRERHDLAEFWSTDHALEQAAGDRVP